MNLPSNNQKGFTLMEIMVVIAVVAVIAVGAFISISKSRLENAKKDAANTIVNALQEAKNRAANGYGTGNWGVHFLSDRIVTFEGTYAGSGNISYLPSLITATSSNPDIIFIRLIAKPTVATTTTITLTPTSGSAVTVTVSADGVITSPY